jgi:hypothetical protein
MAQLAHHDPLGDAEVGHLLDYLATVSDPRALSGRRHPLVAILALAAAAVLTAPGPWPRSPSGPWSAPQAVRAALGARREAPEYWAVPSEATIRSAKLGHDSRANRHGRPDRCDDRQLTHRATRAA